MFVLAARGCFHQRIERFSARLTRSKKKKKKKRKEASLVFRFSKFLKARSKPPFSRSSLSLEWNSATTENRSRHPVRRERTHAHSHHPAIEAELIALYLIKPRIISLTRADLYSSFLPLQQQASLPSFTIFHLHPCARGWRNRSRGSTVSPLVRQPAGFSCTSLFLFLFFSFSLFLSLSFLLTPEHPSVASTHTIVAITATATDTFPPSKNKDLPAHMTPDSAFPVFLSRNLPSVCVRSIVFFLSLFLDHSPPIDNSFYISIRSADNVYTSTIDVLFVFPRFLVSFSSAYLCVKLYRY